MIYVLIRVSCWPMWWSFDDEGFGRELFYFVCGILFRSSGLINRIQVWWLSRGYVCELWFLIGFLGLRRWKVWTFSKNYEIIMMFLERRWFLCYLSLHCVLAWVLIGFYGFWSCWVFGILWWNWILRVYWHVWVMVYWRAPVDDMVLESW